MSSQSSLPMPLLEEGLSYIRPPSPERFEKEFPGILPAGTSMMSSWLIESPPCKERDSEIEILAFGMLGSDVAGDNFLVADCINKGITRYYDFSPKASETVRRIILIHGAGTSAIGLAPLAHKLTSGDNHVVLYDLWGHGNSSTPLEAHTPALAHAQILELLVHLRWSEPVHFVGFSLGGSIVATFVATHPLAALSATIIAGTGLFPGQGPFGKLTNDAILQIMQSGDPKEGYRERLREGYIDAGAIQQWERQHHRGYERSLISYWKNINLDKHSSYKAIAEGPVRVLEILGENDQAVIAGETTQDLLRLGWETADIKVIPAATHELVRTHVEQVAHLLVEFWAV